ncbi:MAG TPA: peptidoglycan DD-metalloendopeptidase family protein [Bacteroidales bacterium]|nr:peptidoglycan DD-metalloendopeptidase family protein [Bacteroidales bacterium]
MEEIAFVDNLLKTTAKEKSESLSELKIIGNKLNLRENVIKGLQEEISLLMNRIDLNNLAIEMMENDLNILKEDYSRSIVNSYRLRKGGNELGYILSARDFNQGYKRIKYLQQIAEYRRKESEIITELKEQVETSKKKLLNDLSVMSDLKGKQEQQKSLLQVEQNRKQRIVRALSSKEKQLQKELEERKRIARRIENEIAKMIEEERRRSTRTELTPEERLKSENFAENRGRLPWPVESGIITSKFGVQNHPVLKYVTENNPGIEITSSGQTNVRAVFSGEVARVVLIPGANIAVIIRHGKYFTVYQNIVNVKVKTGDKVETKQLLGNVFLDEEDGNKAILKFMIFEEKSKIDPELWISKKK